MLVVWLDVHPDGVAQPHLSVSTLRIAVIIETNVLGSKLQ